MPKKTVFNNVNNASLQVNIGLYNFIGEVHHLQVIYSELCAPEVCRSN